MIELENFENQNQHSSPDIFQVKRLSKITFIGLFNSFNSVHNKLAKLKEQGSIDILTVKKDLIETKD